jgi:hypothetical protein
VQLPALNPNNVFFANVFQAAFGNSRINSDSEFGTAHILAGYPVGPGILSIPQSIPAMFLEQLQR